MIQKLPQKLLELEGVTEIDIGDEIKVANANSEEILVVDFPSAVRLEEILVDFPTSSRQQSSQRDVHAGANIGRTDSVLESESDIDDDGFLGFPDGGRKSFTCVEGGTALQGSTTREADLKRSSLPSTIEILITDEAATAEIQNDQNDGNWVDSSSQSFELRPIDAGTDDQENYSSKDGQEPVEWVDVVDGEEFEKPSNWVGDEESSAGDSEYRQQTIRMNQERRASAALTRERRLSAASGQARRLSAASGQGRRTSGSSTSSQGGLYPKEYNEHLRKERQPNEVVRRSSMPAKIVPDPDPFVAENPFSAGFEFAKAAPVPQRPGRRPSLANTTYTFEKYAASQPRRGRRASVDTYRPTNTGYTDGLKAFGANQQDIRHILN